MGSDGGIASRIPGRGIIKIRRSSTHKQATDGPVKSGAFFFGVAHQMGRDGINGRITWDERAESICTVLRAMRRTRPVPSGAPVFGLTSKCGKLLEEMSRR